MQQASLSSPKTYFDLISKVGSKGVYQRNLFILFSFTWFIAGILLMGTSFLFMNPKFDCLAHEISTENCQETICSMDQSEWSKYLEKPWVRSLATDFGPYLCKTQMAELDALRMILYIGTFIGYMCFLFITDNYGRKISLIITWSVTFAGVVLLCVAQNMTMACVGLFFAGAGCESAIRITMAIFGEVVDYYRRQSYSVALQIAFGLSGVCIGIAYWIISDWRLISIIFCAVPCGIILIFIIFYFQETPKFLITKHGIDKALQSLNRIGRINLGQKNILTKQQIEGVYQEQELGGDKFTITITPYHLFKYKSLRCNTICCCFLFLFITYLYFGPIIIVDDLGINPFQAQIFISLSEVFAYPFSFWFIQRLPRIKSGYVCFTLSSIFTGILIFVIPPSDCQKCPQVIFQSILIFSSRFVISFYFSVFFLYVTEIFPLRARGLGFGIASAAGAIASSSGQFIFTEMEERSINPMILFTAFALCSIGVLRLLEETLNKPLETEIKEIQELKDKQKVDVMRSQVQSNRDSLHQEQINVEMIAAPDDCSDNSSKSDDKHNKGDNQDFDRI